MPAGYTFEWRRGTASQWASVNPVLKAGEPGLETDTLRLKVGNGVSTWTALAYLNAADFAAFATAYQTLKQQAKAPDGIIEGNISRDASGNVTSAGVVWNDGTVGTYTADVIDPTFGVLAYHITYGSPATKTFTQPAMTRDATTGAVTVRPAMTVA